jgi:hypothetical protein
MCLYRVVLEQLACLVSHLPARATDLTRLYSLVLYAYPQCQQNSPHLQRRQPAHLVFFMLIDVPLLLAGLR